MSTVVKIKKNYIKSWNQSLVLSKEETITRTSKHMIIFRLHFISIKFKKIEFQNIEKKKLNLKFKFLE